MKSFRLGIVLCGCLAVVSAVACTGSAPEVVAASSVSASSDHAAHDPVEHGEYLVNILGCGDCHTPFRMGPNGPEPDMSRFLSGHPAELVMPEAPVMTEPWMWAGAATNTAFAGPWGVSFAINLTPDVSGLAAWDESIFVEAMRSGKHWGQSRPILPPMPWPAYSKMTDEDLKAVFAYLRTVPAVSNTAPEAIVAPLPGSVATGAF